MFCRVKNRRRFWHFVRGTIAALLWVGVGLHLGTLLPREAQTPEVAATLVALTQQVVALEQRWKLVVGEGSAPALQAPLPPFPWGGNAPLVGATSTTRQPH